MVTSAGPLLAVPLKWWLLVWSHTSSSRFTISRPIPPRALQFGSTSHHLYIRTHPQWRQEDVPCYRSAHHHVVSVLVIAHPDDIGIRYFRPVDWKRSFRDSGIFVSVDVLLDEERVGIIFFSETAADHADHFGSVALLVEALPTECISPYQKRCPQRVRIGLWALAWQIRQL